MRPLKLNSRIMFRWLLIVCQALTLLITWPLWQVHQSPPMLPLIPLPTFDLGALLLLSLGLILIFPRIGLIAHTTLIIYAVMIDQLRLQPEIISLVLLLWSTLPNPHLQTIGRAHLIALWFWAGTHKLLSVGFLTDTGPLLLGALLPFAPEWFVNSGGYLIALTEILAGILAFLPATRRLSGWLAFGVHIGILLTLSPLGLHWNQAVWPWNAALAVAGFALIWNWSEPLVTRRRLTTVVVLLILVMPAGYYVGMVDAYLAHNLYTSNVPRAISTAFRPTMTWDVLNVPMPPEHRLFEQYFRLVCGPNDQLTIRDSRWWFQRQGLGERKIRCLT